MLISVTDLAAYLYCPRTLYMQKVLGYEEEFKEQMLLGAIRHKLYDAINKAESEIVRNINSFVTKDSLAANYRGFYIDTLKEVIAKHEKALQFFEIPPEEAAATVIPSIVADADLRAENIHNFLSAHKVFGDELWLRLMPKILTEVKAKSERLKLSGSVDRVELYHDSLVPVELKTGKLPSERTWLSHRMQIAAYMLLLREKFQLPITSGRVLYLDHNVAKNVFTNPFLEFEVISTTNKVIELLQSKQLPPQCGRNGCRNCLSRY